MTPATMPQGTPVRIRDDGRHGTISWPPFNVEKPGRPPRIRALVNFTADDGSPYQQFIDAHRIELAPPRLF